MDAEDSASDKPHSSRHSRRESPSPNHEEIGHRASAQSGERSSSRRSRSQRSHGRGLEEKRKHTPSRRMLSYPDDTEVKFSHEVTATGKTESTRHQKKRKSRHRNTPPDEFIETPVTRVLREVPDDILDAPHSSIHGQQQYSYYGEGDSEHYRIRKDRDCVYVEHYDGFSSVPRQNALADPGDNLPGRWFDLSTATALDVAIAVQRLWLPLSDFCHGLLAGTALLQAIVVDRLLGSTSEEALQFISFYSNFSLIFTTMFLLLASVCLVSVFDRLDLARGDWPYLVDLLSVRPRIRWLLIPSYVGGLALALAAAKGDDFINLSQYENSNYTLPKVDFDLLQSWHVLNSLRCACVVVGWLLLSASHPPDLLLNLLVNLMSHQNSDAIQKAKTVQSISH